MSREQRSIRVYWDIENIRPGPKTVEPFFDELHNKLRNLFGSNYTPPLITVACTINVIEKMKPSVLQFLFTNNVNILCTPGKKQEEADRSIEKIIRHDLTNSHESHFVLITHDNDFVNVLHDIQKLSSKESNVVYIKCKDRHHNTKPLERVATTTIEMTFQKKTPVSKEKKTTVSPAKKTPVYELMHCSSKYAPICMDGQNYIVGETIYFKGKEFIRCVLTGFAYRERAGSLEYVGNTRKNPDETYKIIKYDPPKSKEKKLGELMHCSSKYAPICMDGQNYIVGETIYFKGKEFIRCVLTGFAYRERAGSLEYVGDTRKNPDETYKIIKYDPPKSKEKKTTVSPAKNTPVSEEKKTSVSEEKKTPVSEEKKTPVSEEKKTPVSEEKKTPVSEEKKTSVSEEKKTSVSEEKKTPVSEEKKTPVSEEKKTPVSEEKNVYSLSETQIMVSTPKMHYML
jgi:predicted SprT family Zn-dependent metalloprotease